MAVEVKLTGFDELAKKLREIVPAMRKRVVRNALAAGARLVRDEARLIRDKPGVLRRQAQAGNPSPKIKKPNRYRAEGTVKKAISARVSKRDRKVGDIGAFVNVLPAKGAKFKTSTRKFFGIKIRTRTQTRVSQRGAKSPTDPFYWRFLEFGTRKMAKREFLKPAAAKLPAALEIFKTQVGRWLDKLNDGGKVQP